MGRNIKLDQSNILQKVSAELDKLSPRYVVCINYRRSKGKANVNIGITKCELIYRVFDSEKEDWTHQQAVIWGTCEDSDGTSWWMELYSQLKHDVEVLNSK